MVANQASSPAAASNDISSNLFHRNAESLSSEKSGRHSSHDLSSEATHESAEQIAAITSDGSDGYRFMIELGSERMVLALVTIQPQSLSVPSKWIGPLLHERPGITQGE
jgi:hypothetical protein